MINGELEFKDELCYLAYSIQKIGYICYNLLGKWYTTTAVVDIVEFESVDMLGCKS